MKMNKTTIKKVLQESSFDPKNEFNFVTDLNDPNYCMCKAMEIIGKARQFDNKQLFLKQAISLLAIARIQLLLLIMLFIGCDTNASRELEIQEFVKQARIEHDKNTAIREKKEEEEKALVELQAATDSVDELCKQAEIMAKGMENIGKILDEASKDTK